MHSPVLPALILLIGLTSMVGTAAPKRTLTFEERLNAQRAIEEVYWRHRIWPSDNPRLKPPLEAIVPENAIRYKVEDYLRKSNALSALWGRPVSAEQLQQEINRITRDTRNPALLGELFDALSRDPVRIAECLARPMLVERSIHNLYAHDSRFHGGVRAAAVKALEEHPALEEMHLLGGGYREIELSQSDHWAESPGATSENLGPLLVDSHQFDDPLAPIGQEGDLRRALDSAVRIQSDSIVTDLQEDESRFLIVGVLGRSPDRLRLGVVEWPKTSFTDWWDSVRSGFPAELEPASGHFKLPTIGVQGCNIGAWQPTRASVPDRRINHTTIWSGTEMIVWGGYVVSGEASLPTNTGGRYNPSTDTWSPTSWAAPSARVYHSAVWTGTEMIVWGGSTTNSALNTGARYDPTTDQWTPTSTTGAPSPRAFHSAVWTGGEMVVWGEGTGGRYDPVTDTWRSMATFSVSGAAFWTGSEVLVWGDAAGGRYDPTQDRWRVMSSVDAPSGFGSAVWTGSELIFWSGQTRSGSRYDAFTDVWTPISSIAAPSARIDYSMVWSGREVIIWGGLATSPFSFLNDGARFNPTLNNWIPVASRGAPAPGVYQSAVWTGTEMMVWGGSPHGTGGRYSPDSDSWILTGTGNTPSGRAGATTLWTGSEMIVWGGRASFFTPSNAGALYDPTTDDWRPMSVPQGLQARADHSAVWTGTEMIVWGGQSITSVLATGDRYNPATDMWSPVSMTDAPASRTHHTAIWTGSDMIVWAGIETSSTNTGGLYNPINDNWRPVSTAGAPTGRYGTRAVWTGSEMIVWGGFSLAGPSASGGRYDPVRDQWSPTPLTGAPAGRIWHSAAWTGTEMIVWGGLEPTFPVRILDDGGRYNPTTNSWLPVGMIGAPSARFDAGHIWTGSEMIVWGGNGLQGALATGGRYSAAANRWTPTEPAGAPPARIAPAAVWTGREMIVWGGRPVTAIGARYCADPLGTVYEWYPDADGDGYGDPTKSPISSRERVSGHAANNLDCDDESADARPGATEICNGIDDDCDDKTDEGFDADQDGYAYCVGDCDDGDPSVNPGATERCDGIDDDCDPTTDENIDRDGDEFSACQGDCDDGNPAVNPDALDRNCNGLDDDCSGRVDDRYVPSSTTCGVGTCRATGALICISGMVVDTCTPGPPIPEVCDDLDNDCDGMADDGNPGGGQQCGVSNVGQCRFGITRCSSGVVVCADAVGPIPEACNGLDDDCDGLVPPSEADADQDGFLGCQGDCDDRDATVNPTAVETPGNITDENCDGTSSCSPTVTWRSHGEFVSCVARACEQLVSSAAVTPEQCEVLVAQAADSNVGRTPRVRQPVPPEEP